MRLTIIYDNNAEQKLKQDFGFSCFANNKKILFDTGADSKILLHNMKQLNINPKNIKTIILSHNHFDHTGGLLGFLEKNSNVKVYVLKSFPSSFKKEIKTRGAELIEVSGPIKITKGFYSTGELGTLIKEQSLVIDSDQGLVVITGCAHPGIVHIVKKVKEQFKKNIYLVLGGFHHPSIEVAMEFKKLGVKKVAPSHCTGEKAIKAFEKEYQKDFIKTGAGKIIVIK